MPRRVYQWQRDEPAPDPWVLAPVMVSGGRVDIPPTPSPGDTQKASALQGEQAPPGAGPRLDTPVSVPPRPVLDVPLPARPQDTVPTPPPAPSASVVPPVVPVRVASFVPPVIGEDSERVLRQRLQSVAESDQPVGKRSTRWVIVVAIIVASILLIVGVGCVLVAWQSHRTSEQHNQQSALCDQYASVRQGIMDVSEDADALGMDPYATPAKQCPTDIDDAVVRELNQQLVTMQTEAAQHLQDDWAQLEQEITQVIGSYPHAKSTTVEALQGIAVYGSVQDYVNARSRLADLRIQAQQEHDTSVQAEAKKNADKEAADKKVQEEAEQQSAHTQVHEQQQQLYQTEQVPEPVVTNTPVPQPSVQPQPSTVPSWSVPSVESDAGLLNRDPGL